MADAKEHLVFVTSFIDNEAGAIVAFNLNTETGALSELQRNSGIENPFYLALAPDRKTLYVAYALGDHQKDFGHVAAFGVVGDTGELVKLNDQPADGITPCYVDVDPTGKAVVFANYNSGSVGAYPVKPDGSLDEISSFVKHSGASLVNPRRQEAAHAHCAVISPCGNHVHVSDLGLDQVVGYNLDAASATLTPLNQPFVRTVGGGGPRHFTYNPQVGSAYANNELTSTVNVFSYEAEKGLLIERQVISTLPDDFEGNNSTADIKTTPDGRYLYCSNRGHDSIAIYAIADDGCLTVVDIQSSLGRTAQNLAITPDGETLLCANLSGNEANVVVFRIDTNSGKLTSLGEPVALDNPSCIAIV